MGDKILAGPHDDTIDVMQIDRIKSGQIFIDLESVGLDI
jgi:hypothetical protein